MKKLMLVVLVFGISSTSFADGGIHTCGPIPPQACELLLKVLPKPSKPKPLNLDIKKVDKFTWK